MGVQYSGGPYLKNLAPIYAEIIRWKEIFGQEFSIHSTAI